MQLPDATEVRDCAPDLPRLAKHKTRGVIITATSDNDEADFVYRFFCPGLGIDEDPVTGSAHCCLAPFWAERQGRTSLTGHQISRRGGVVDCELAGDRVLLGGHAVTVLAGEVLATPTGLDPPPAKASRCCVLMGNDNQTDPADRPACAAEPACRWPVCRSPMARGHASVPARQKDRQATRETRAYAAQVLSGNEHDLPVERRGATAGMAAEWLERGKPESIIDLQRHKAFRPDLPRVIRPDILLTEDGLKITELDSVPGGIGLTAWLNRTYAEAGTEVLGRHDRHARRFRRHFR